MHLPQHVAWYLICFLIGTVLGLIPIWIVEVLENTDDSLSATIVAIGGEMEWAVVLSAAFSFVGVEGFTMLAEMFLKQREAKGREEGRAEGRAEGRVEGRVEGREEARQQLASRFEDMTSDERLAEIDRLIEESRRANRRSS